jgi:hypothetical protein
MHEIELAPQQLEAIKTWSAGVRQQIENLKSIPVTVEFLNDFSGPILDALIKIIQEVVGRYFEILELSEITTYSKEDEEEAFRFKPFSLPSINELFDLVTEVGLKLDSARAQMSHAQQIDLVFLPPGPSSFKPANTPDPAKVEEKKTFPKVEMLLLLIREHFGVEEKDVQVFKGLVSDEMYREEPYYFRG